MGKHIPCQNISMIIDLFLQLVMDLERFLYERGDEKYFTSALNWTDCTHPDEMFAGMSKSSAVL